MSDDPSKAAQARAEAAQGHPPDNRDAHVAARKKVQADADAAAEKRRLSGTLSSGSGPHSEDFGAVPKTRMSPGRGSAAQSDHAEELEPTALSPTVMFHDTPTEIPTRTPRETDRTFVVYRAPELGVGDWLTQVVGDGITVTLRRNQPTAVPTGLAKLLVALESDQFKIEECSEEEYHSAERFPEAMSHSGS